MKYCFLDLETTGFEPKEDSIIECSFIVMEDEVEIARFDKVFKPDKSPLNDFVENLTGITQQEIDKNNLVFSDYNKEIQNLIGDSIIVGHNIDFDINFLIGNDVDVEKNPRIDTHELARILLPLEKSYALEVLTKKYGFTHENAHRAMSDVVGCEKFFYFLLEKINALPKNFLDDISEFLKTKTDWGAKDLFLSSEGSGNLPEKEISAKATPDPSKKINLDNNNQSVNIKFCPSAVEDLTQTALNNETPTVIVTPRVNQFDHLEKFPTPEVVLDAEKLENFTSNREKLNDQETTFYLKLKHRSHIGYRGLFFCDLFFKERELWNEVHTNESSKIFQEIINQKSKNQTLVASPEAYFRFIENSIFSERYVILDEGEQTAKSLLFTPSKTFSLQPFLNHFDEKIATATQFTVSNICRDFIEKKLGHQIGHFPQKILLDFHDDIKHFIAELSQTVVHEDWDFWKEILSNPPAQSVRWLNYHPESGNLSFGYWHPEPWRALKTQLCEKKVLLVKRSEGSDSEKFFNTFLGLSSLEEISQKENRKTPRLIIPEGLVSPKSPDFNDFTVEQILRLFERTEGNLAVNFSSLDSLRNVCEQMNQKIDKKNTFLVGEKVNGGSGKVLELIKNQADKRIIFCYQRMNDPALKKINFPNVIFQKFPFAPPEPLLDKIKETMSQSGQSFWDVWILTQSQADISRRIDVLGEVENLYFLDSRENAAWGKKVLKNVFA